MSAWLEPDYYASKYDSIDFESEMQTARDEAIESLSKMQIAALFEDLKEFRDLYIEKIRSEYFTI